MEVRVSMSLDTALDLPDWVRKELLATSRSFEVNGDLWVMFYMPKEG